uniref:F-box domain-containing protein n=1 Tax=Oryza glumipatula TaxID=40148 RepID=A0A0D9YAV1_9ORYZ
MEAVIAECRPKPLFTTGPFLSAVGGGGGGVDRISGLPDDLLFVILSKLPVRDAVATSALSPRWKSLWSSVSLRLDDAGLLHRRDGTRLGREGVAATVSAVLAAHPGPVPAASVGCCLSSDDQGYQLGGWLRALAAKGVRQLCLMGAPWSPRAALPSAVFSCSSLRRLFLGSVQCNWDLIPDHACFPELREIQICNALMKSQDLSLVLAVCPALETVEILASRNKNPHRANDHTIRNTLLWKSVAKEVNVLDTPCLSRVVLWQDLLLPHSRYNSKVTISRATKMRIFGYLDTGINTLVINETTVKVNTNISFKTHIPSVKVLGLYVHFGVRKEALMSISFLRCFPEVETLHITSKTDKASEAEQFSFWGKVDPVECVTSHLKKLVFHGMPWCPGNFEFLKFIVEGAYLLEKVLIVLPKGTYTSMHSVITKLKLAPLTSASWASHICKMEVVQSSQGTLSYQRASDRSVDDPLDYSL